MNKFDKVLSMKNISENKVNGEIKTFLKGANLVKSESLYDGLVSKKTYEKDGNKFKIRIHKLEDSLYRLDIYNL